MKKLKQLYRYVGGKAKLLKRYTPFFKGLRPEYCVDYFGGSGIMSVWFHHLYPEAKLYLNEKDPDIYGLFKCIQENYDRFDDEIYDLQRTKEIWKGFDAQKRLYYSIRDYYNLQFVSICAEDGHTLDFENEEDREELDAMGYINFGPLGYEVFQHACYLLLRKLSFSGVNMRNKKREYTSSAGIRSPNQPCYDPEVLTAYKEMLDHAELLNKDYRDVDIQLPCTLHYFDPPYVDRGKNQFIAHFDWVQTEELCEYVQQVSEHSTVFMSNSDHPKLKKLMKGFQWYSFPSVGGMHNKKSKEPVRETLFYKIHPSIAG